MATWPGTLPQGMQESGYSESPPDVSIRSKMDVGPAKVRRRVSAGVRPITGKIFLTVAESEILDAFYESTLLGGSLAFTWINQRTGGSAEFRFTGPPKYTVLGGTQWVATLAFEILP